MSSIKRFRLLLLAVCAISALATSSASASVFLAHPPGGVFPVLLLALQTGNQTFTVSSGTVTCTGLKGHGIATTLSTLTQDLTIAYTGCTAFGLAAKVSPVSYRFRADNGLVTLLNTVSITAVACTVTVPSTKNQSLQTVKYLNVGREIILHSEVKGITSSGTGAACTFAEESAGKYTGSSLLIGDGAAVRWDQS
jgi:hypothetical protein